MASVLKKPDFLCKEEHPSFQEEGHDEVQVQGRGVTRSVKLRSSVSESQSQPLDKEIVLRRIRQRKRINKVRNVIQSFLSQPFSGDPANIPASDAFSSP
ncbi:hypothetical protein AMTRI_Chr13g125040 [Amborella trichopoda]|uniref:Uncharacterized protein n=1 Tax=Amborella trichopoda TaxID=13333 RepID=U5D616_AMBTC|nr:hypothetical protein AMTR_s00059p00194080 [Amborella trichopoda]